MLAGLVECVRSLHGLYPKRVDAGWTVVKNQLFQS
jgi:hypothetical protein